MTVIRSMVAHWRLVCLLCGRDDDIKLPEHTNLAGPILCPICGGRAMAEYEGLSLPVDMSMTDWPKPKCGRPPRWLVKQREKRAQDAL